MYEEIGRCYLSSRNRPMGSPDARISRQEFEITMVDFYNQSKESKIVWNYSDCKQLKNWIKYRELMLDIEQYDYDH